MSRTLLAARRASTVVAPTITAAPVLSWTIGVGTSPSVTGPTYTPVGVGETVLYTLRRDGVDVVGLTGVSEATIEAHVTSTAAGGDVGPDIDLFVEVTNSGGSDDATSNVVTYDHATRLPSHDIAFFNAGGLTLADSGTTIDISVGLFGGRAGTLSMQAPAATNRPAYSATGGPSSTVAGDFDGVDNCLRDAAVATGVASVGRWDLRAWWRSDGAAETSGDNVARVRPPAGVGTDLVSANVNTTPLIRGSTGGTGGTNSLGTTNPSSAFGMQSFGAYNGAGTGSQRVAWNGTAEDTDAITHAVWSGSDFDFSIGGSTVGTTCVAGLFVGWAIGWDGSTAASHLLSADQITEIRALGYYHGGLS